MGAKHASIHLRSDTPDELIPALKKQFGKKKGPSQKDLAILQMIEGFARKNIESIADEGEKAEKEAAIAAIMGKAKDDMGEDEGAVIVVRAHFVSLYWYDHIRVDNLGDCLNRYARNIGVPALGVGVYDDSNFVIAAARVTDTGQMEECRGTYWFDEEQIEPVRAEELCRVVCADFLLSGLRSALACLDGEAMAGSFEANTGLPILMDATQCRKAGMTEFLKWNGATVFLTAK